MKLKITNLVSSNYEIMFTDSNKKDVRIIFNEYEELKKFMDLIKEIFSHKHCLETTTYLNFEMDIK